MGVKNFQHFSPKPIDKKQLQKQVNSLKVFDNPKKRAAYNPATRRNWIKNIKSAKAGAHPLDKAIIALAAKAGDKATNLHKLLIFCETQLKESNVPFSRGAIEVRLSILMDHKLINDVRAVNPKLAKVVKKKPVVAKADPLKLKANPLYKTWHVYGNPALVKEYRLQQKKGNTVAMKEIEEFTIAINHKRPVEAIKSMLATGR
ncbi:MAG: hypothetical protein WC821_01985 [archaeon]